MSIPKSARMRLGVGVELLPASSRCGVDVDDAADHVARVKQFEKLRAARSSAIAAPSMLTPFS